MNYDRFSAGNEDKQSGDKGQRRVLAIPIIWISWGMRIHSFLLTIAIALSSVCAAQPSADEIIAKYVNLIGGESQWKGLRSMYMSGTYNYGGLKFDFVSYALSPNKYKYIVKYNGKRFVQSFDGKNGWKMMA
jgi:hypothetical protein